LRKGWGEERCQRIAKYRLGNEMRGGMYWEKDEERKCRMCGMEEEDWKHVWDECVDWGVGRSWDEMMEVILGEEGEGEEWLKKVEEWRGVECKEKVSEEEEGEDESENEDG